MNGMLQNKWCVVCLKNDLCVRNKIPICMKTELLLCTRITNKQPIPALLFKCIYTTLSAIQLFSGRFLPGLIFSFN